VPAPLVKLPGQLEKILFDFQEIIFVREASQLQEIVFVREAPQIKLLIIRPVPSIQYSVIVHPR